MLKQILICGVGGFGIRYIEGILRSSIRAHVTILDRSIQRILAVRELVDNFSNFQNELVFCQDISEAGSRFDLVIVATGADQRLLVISEIARSCRVNFWVLEKFLAQSAHDLDEIWRLCEVAEGCWVNTPRRATRLFSDLKSKLSLIQPLSCSVSAGELGIASNAVHFIDAVEWMTGERAKSIDTSGLSRQWYESKRPSNWDIYGSLGVMFDKGSELELTSFPGNDAVSWCISSRVLEIFLDETRGFTLQSASTWSSQPLSRHSDHVGGIIQNILDTGACSLTPLFESLRQHHLMLRPLLTHWNSYRDSNSGFLPIT